MGYIGQVPSTTFHSGTNTFTGDIKLEGATANDYETSLTVVDPTADRTITFPDASGTVALTSDLSNSSSAADDITTGDAAVNIETSSGNITIDAQGNDTDIIFKGTDSDGSGDITMLTLDGSEGGTATFNSGINTSGDVTITSTDDGATADPTLNLHRNSASPALQDIIGKVSFQGENDASQIVNYSGINGRITGITDGNEHGEIDFTVISNGNQVTPLLLKGNGNTVFQARNVLIGSTASLIFEGSTNDNNEITIAVTDPTTDRTITLPDASGTVALATPYINAGTLLLTTDISNDASVDFSSTYITDDYDYYDVVLSDIIPANDNVYLMARFGFSGTVDTGSLYAYRVYNYGIMPSDTWETSANSYGTSSGILMTTTYNMNLGSQTAEQFNGVYRFYNFRSTSTYKGMVQQEMQSFSSAARFSTWYYIPAIGYYSNHYNQKCDTLRIMAGSGNLASGRMRLYGWKK
tara:strand:- start:1987 stop:3390 length:1404 start_codon:yes stop_codon:yes gene_type:complete